MSETKFRDDDDDPFGFASDPGKCAECSEPYEWVRPGKSQPTCDCDYKCPFCGEMRRHYSIGEIAKNMGGLLCASCDADNPAPTEWKMSEKLSDVEIRLLGALTEECGRLTRDVAEKADIKFSSKHQSSGAARSWLMRLKKRGLVDFYDNEKPTIWKRTEAGTRAYHGLPEKAA